MRNRKYKNYGPVPRNEFTITNTSKTYSDTDLGQAPLSDEAKNEKYVARLKTHNRFGRLRGQGWLRSQSTNGWRAEAASQHDEIAEDEQKDNTRTD